MLLKTRRRTKSRFMFAVLAPISLWIKQIPYFASKENKREHFEGIKAKITRYSDDTISNRSKRAIPLIFRVLSLFWFWDIFPTLLESTSLYSAMIQMWLVFESQERQWCKANWLNIVVCNRSPELVQHDSALMPLTDMKYHPCPGQKNAIDGGLFAVAVVSISLTVLR